MDIVSAISKLHDMIIEHYDIIWQEDWYEFYDIAEKLCSDCNELLPVPLIQERARKLLFALDEGGDSPSQEEWFDICDAVCGLAEGLYMKGILDKDFFEVQYASLYIV